MIFMIQHGQLFFDKAGGATWTVAGAQDDNTNMVLNYTHSSTSASWIKNKDTLGGYTSGKYEVGTDLYIPSTALSASTDYVQLQINGDAAHCINLVSDQKATLGSFDTKDFPRDKWFRVRFVFDMDKLKYDLEIVEDGVVRN